VNPFDAVVCRLRRRKAAETSQVVPT
jgi:hypothetical protein